MGIREAFYMTFSYKEIRLCLAIGKPVLIVTGYGVQARARRSSQDGRRRTVGAGRSASSIQRPASRYGVNRSAVRYGGQRLASSSQRSAVSVQRSASSSQRSAVSVQQPAFRYGDKAPFVPHLFCAAARFLPTDYRFPKCPLTSEKLSTGANRELSHLAVDKAVSSV